MRIPGLGAARYHLLTKPFDTWETWSAARKLPALRKAVMTLAPTPWPRPEVIMGKPAIVAHYLTGTRVLHYTLCSAYSLLNVCAPELCLRIISDGTLTQSDRELIKTLLGDWAIVETDEAQNARIEALFPIEKFPALRRGRDQSALYRKLMDVHAGNQGWTWFVDSDTFFWRRPNQLLRGARDGKLSLYSPDLHSNYGHPESFISEILGQTVLPHVNSGLTGMVSARIDWGLLEFWLSQFELRGGTHDFWEQALTAMHLTRDSAQALPASDYVLSPSVSEVRNPQGIFHHYAGNAKNRFVRLNVPQRLFESRTNS